MTDSSSPVAGAPRSARKRLLLVMALSLLAVAAGAVFLFSAKTHQSTDAAYLQADETVVSAEGRGRITELRVAENASVKAGDLLARIDSEEADARIQLAEADQRAAQAAVQSAQAALLTLQAEERLAEASTRAVESQRTATEAQRQRTEQDQQRYDALVQDGAVSLRDAEAARAAAVSARSENERSARTLAVSQSQAEVIRSKRALQQAALEQAESQLARSQAALLLARQDRARTEVRAPVDGVAAALQVRVGDYVTPAARLLTLVPVRRLYVMAYFKETQVARMRPGLSAQVEIDGWDGQVLQASVDSLAPGTGARFALLPFEPGSGNFTKVVQRVPVRLHFAAGQEVLLAQLRPGLSSTVEVDLRD